MRETPVSPLPGERAAKKDGMPKQPGHAVMQEPA